MDMWPSTHRKRDETEPLGKSCRFVLDHLKMKIPGGFQSKSPDSLSKTMLALTVLCQEQDQS